MKPTIQLRLGQHLTMTPQLQQAIRLLQLSTLDLRQEIQEALESNLMLEAEDEVVQRETERDADGSEGGASSTVDGGLETGTQTDAGVDNHSERELGSESDSMPDELPVDTSWDEIYDSIGSGGSVGGSGGSEEGLDALQQQSLPETLLEHLNWQLNLTHLSDVDHAIATAIIEAIDHNGYLTQTLEDIQDSVGLEEIGLPEIEAVLHLVQQFDPPGVGARSPQECLAIQLRQLPVELPFRTVALELVEDFFELLIKQDRVLLKRQLEINEQQVIGAIRLIRGLNPHPGDAVEAGSPGYVEPDVFVFKREGRWVVELNSDAAPRLRINPDYASLIRRADNSDDNNVLRNHMQEARWFIKSLQSRNETLLNVTTKIVEFQRDFFDYGVEAMRPLVLRDIAEALEMHESTISRVTTRKYMHTPRGTFELKYFFSSHVGTTSGGEASATAIRAQIKKLIENEKSEKPLSDNKIAAILVERGIDIARRTVAKYRESMAIPPSNQRKRLA